jgi:hypothetical protein
VFRTPVSPCDRSSTVRLKSERNRIAARRRAKVVEGCAKDLGLVFDRMPKFGPGVDRPVQMGIDGAIPRVTLMRRSPSEF